jgi:hypothetical protein
MGVKNKKTFGAEFAGPNANIFDYQLSIINFNGNGPDILDWRLSIERQRT